MRLNSSERKSLVMDMGEREGVEEIIMFAFKVFSQFRGCRTFLEIILKIY